MPISPIAETPRHTLMDGLGGEPKKLTSAPISVTCYICGKGYGTRSIDNHLPQCARKFEAEQMLLPREQRRNLPSKPEVLKGGGASGQGRPMSLDEQNQAVADNYLENVRVPCPNCGRKFGAQDRLDVHLRSCKAVHDI